MAPPNPRVKAAVGAMKNMGFSSKCVVDVLKRLLKVYEDNWEYIEENNYQVLIESILEKQEPEAARGKKQDEVVDNDSEQTRKRSRKQREWSPSPTSLETGASCDSSLKKPKVEGDVSPKLDLIERGADPVLRQVDDRLKTTVLVLPQPSPSLERAVHASPLINQRETRVPERAEHGSPLINRRETRALALARKPSAADQNAEASSLWGGVKSRELICYKEPNNEQSIEVQKITIATSLRSEDKQAEDDQPKFEVPVAMICPPAHPIPAINEDNSSVRDMLIFQANNGNSPATQNSHEAKRKGIPSDLALDNGEASELVTSHEASSATTAVASSDTGEVKLLFSFNSNRMDFRIPSLDDVFKMVEERCMKSYKILQPDFSVMKVMRELCQCALELSTVTSDDRQGDSAKFTPEQFTRERSNVQSMLGVPASFLNDQCATDEINRHKNDMGNEKGMELGAPEGTNFALHSLVVVQQPQIALGDLRPLHDPNDISKGEERVRISLVNEVSNEKYPSSFHYIPRNIIYQNAYVNFSLARIGDEDCCSDCFGDCIAAAIPCACARETGGEFAYTSDGLVKGAFLDECISMYSKPEKHHHVYCKDCPLERSKKGAMPGKCKGHLVRKFIKECWSKCGCNMQCKNRVVQCGITCNLQVFFTPEGKGWGIRTLDELPRGAFVCEYVGEVLTNMELYNRTIQATGNAKHTYPVLLDADWGSEGLLKDEEALCLDATFYGNVARFVNHRCVDANMVEIPVEVETPDRHYYHLAFFTNRKIEQNEELTWDYGIDFDDVNHPVKAFKCRCGSKYCRDTKRSRSRSKSVVSSQQVNC